MVVYGIRRTQPTGRSSDRGRRRGHDVGPEWSSGSFRDLLESALDAMVILDRSLSLSASVGFALIDGDTEGNEILAEADRAMYQDKTRRPMA